MDKRLVKYEKTKGELRHEAMVKQAKAYANVYQRSKHVGSKPMSQLAQYVPENKHM